jgi:nickel-dependent lactate racemase
MIKRGGVVILASCCREGVGSSQFKSLLLKAKSANQIMAKITSPDFFQIDQWMVQHLCQVVEKAEVYLFSENIRRNPGNLVKSIPSVEAGIKIALNKLGQDAKITVIPSGPYAVPFLKR